MGTDLTDLTADRSVQGGIGCLKLMCTNTMDRALLDVLGNKVVDLVTAVALSVLFQPRIIILPNDIVTKMPALDERTYGRVLGVCPTLGRRC